MKRIDYRKARFDQITDEGEYRFLFAASVGQAAKIAMGNVLEGYVHRLLSESGRYDHVLHRLTVNVSEFNQGGRTEHEIDIVGETAGAVDCFNSKSATRSNTEDPHHVVKLYVAARQAVQQLYPTKLVTYRMLRLDGKPIPEYDVVGITTVDMNWYLSTTCKRNVNVEQELKVERCKEYRKAAKRLCRSLGRDPLWGLEILARDGL